MNSDRPNYAPEIRRALSLDPKKLLEELGIFGDGRGHTRQANGWMVRCPVHAERTPSCSVQVKQGELVWKCWGCDAAGDAIALVAASRGLSLGRGFRDTLIECARIAGLWGIVSELEGRSELRRDLPPRPPVAAPPARPEAPRDYPDAGEVASLWEASRPVSDDPDVAAYLAGRAIDPDLVEAKDLARVLPFAGALPPWARCRAGNWREASYRLIVPMFDPAGTMRTVRGWRVGGDQELPKRLPPSGHKAAGVIMADQWAIAMLRGARQPERVVVTEGEPDFLTWATRVNEPRTAVIGIVSGSWTRELGDRFPVGCRVDIRTDHDAAGTKYANEFVSGLARRCFTFRSRENP